jgi:hypothetical protein
MTGIVMDSEGAIHVDLLPLCSTINAQYYSNLFFSAFSLDVCKKQPGKLSHNFIVEHGNVRLHTGNMIKTTFAGQDWEIARHCPYSPDLAPGNFHLFDH